MGTHDLDKIQGPFYYRAKKREEFSFVPLNQTKEMNGQEALEYYSKDQNMKTYADIIKDSKLIPLIMDSKNMVLSLPPLINSDFSKISLETKNVFIEITATDKHKATIALNILLQSFSMYCKVPYSFESVQIIYQDQKESYPQEELYQLMDINKSDIEMHIGYSLDTNTILQLLKKMQLSGQEVSDQILRIEIPFFRSDILHQCDIAEDVAIAYGYNNIPLLYPEVNAIGNQDNIQKFSELIRYELASFGYCEILNYALVQQADITTNILQDDQQNQIVITNPKTIEFEVGRTTLLPGLLKNVFYNKKNKIPFKLFELGDVMYLTDKSHYTGDIIGSCNERKIAVAYFNVSKSGLENIHGVLDLIFQKLFRGKLHYRLENNSKNYFFQQLQCKIFYKDTELGEMGVIHPKVLENYGLNYVGSFLEISLNKLVDILIAKE